MSASDLFLDTDIAHQVDLVWHQNFVLKEMSALMEDEDRAMKARMFAFFSSGSGNIETFLASEMKHNRDLVLRIEAALDPYIRGLVAEETNSDPIVIAALLGNLLPVTTPAAPKLGNPVGRTMREWFESMASQRMTIINSRIRIALSDGGGIQAASEALFGRGGFLARVRNSLETIVRTSLNRAATAARHAVFAANPMVKAVQWVSVLDSRTTPICRSRDGNVYPSTSGPRPPAHPNCRSIVVPVFVHWKKLGIQNPPQFIKNRFTGKPPERVTYTEWLRKQSPKMQDEVLGVKRAKIFRSDPNMTMKGFVNRNGKLLTLEELSKRR